MMYFDENMTANEVRIRLYHLLHESDLDEAEIRAVKKEHKKMCSITVDRESKLAEEGWMTE